MVFVDGFQRVCWGSVKAGLGKLQLGQHGASERKVEGCGESDLLSDCPRPRFSTRIAASAGLERALCGNGLKQGSTKCS
jgi:hypothetical protein